MNKGLAEHIEEVLRWPSPPNSTLRLPGVDCALGTTVGLERSENQDRVFVARAAFASANAEPFLLAAVADGMGGMVEGADCARLCLSTLLSSLIGASSADVVSSLRTSIAAANDKVFDKYRGRGGTTLSALLVSKSGRIAIGNVGDSRAYGFAPGDASTVEQLTEDDTIEAQVAKVRNREPGRGGVKGQLVQFVGVGPELSPHVSLPASETARRAFLLTSDGAHDVPTQVLASILGTAPDSSEAVSRLISVSEWTGGHDNASAVCVFPGAVSAFLSASRERVSLATVWLPHSTVQITGFDREVGSDATQPEAEPAKEGKRQTRKTTKRKANTKKGSAAPKKGRSRKKSEKAPTEAETQVAIEFVEESRPK